MPPYCFELNTKHYKDYFFIDLTQKGQQCALQPIAPEELNQNQGTKIGKFILANLEVSPHTHRLHLYDQFTQLLSLKKNKCRIKIQNQLKNFPKKCSLPLLTPNIDDQFYDQHNQNFKQISQKKYDFLFPIQQKHKIKKNQKNRGFSLKNMSQQKQIVEQNKKEIKQQKKLLLSKEEIKNQLQKQKRTTAHSYWKKLELSQKLLIQKMKEQMKVSDFQKKQIKMKQKRVRNKLGIVAAYQAIGQKNTLSKINRIKNIVDYFTSSTITQIADKVLIK